MWSDFPNVKSDLFPVATLQHEEINRPWTWRLENGLDLGKIPERCEARVINRVIFHSKSFYDIYDLIMIVSIIVSCFFEVRIFISMELKSSDSQEKLSVNLKQFNFKMNNNQWGSKENMIRADTSATISCAMHRQCVAQRVCVCEIFEPKSFLSRPEEKKVIRD